MLLLLSIFLVVAFCATAPSKLEAYNEGIVALTTEINHIGDKYTSEDDSEKHGFIYYGIRYGTAERFAESVLNSDHSYMSDAARLKQGFICPQLLNAVSFPGMPPRNLTINEDSFIWISTSQVSAVGKIARFQLYFISMEVDSILAIKIGSTHRIWRQPLMPSSSPLIKSLPVRTGDEAAKGNYGLGDQKLALEWIKQNIGKYGGDANKISIFGTSAGGASVSALMLDPKVRGSVKSAIAMSGSIFCYWANATNPKLSAATLTSAAGCPNKTSSADIVKCLKGLTMEQLLTAARKKDPMGSMAMKFQFVPVVDNHQNPPFHTAHSKQPDSGQEASFINGYLKDEGASFLSMVHPHLFGPISTVGYAEAVKIVADYVSSSIPCSSQNPSVLKKVLEKYRIADMDASEALLLKIIQVTGDISFAYPAMKDALLYATRGYSASVPNYLYKFSYDPHFRSLGAFHGMDIIPIFGGGFSQLMNNTFDAEATKTFRGMLREAAHNGRLSYDPVGVDLSYIELTQSGKFQKGAENLKDLVKFWDDILEQPCGDPDQPQKAQTLS